MGDCIFCKIINGELPGKFLYKDDEIVVFKDIAPRAPFHVLVVPTKHIESVRTITSDDSTRIANMMMVIKDITEKEHIAEKGYKLIINNGKASGQVVDHLHIHILGAWSKDQEW